MQEIQEMTFRFLVGEDPLEEETSTHPSILASRIPWTEEAGVLQSIVSKRVGHDSTQQYVDVFLYVCVACKSLLNYWITEPQLASLVAHW